MENEMTCTISVDIVWDCPLGDALVLIEKFQGTITSFIAEGPGGGNPELTLTFPTRDLAKSYLAEYDPSTDPEDYL